MNNAKIIVTITPGKPMQVNVVGGEGQSCTELTKPLEEMGAVEEREYKTEYYGVSTTNTNTNIILSS